MTEQLKGTGVALVTPFQQDGTIDYDSLRELINHMVDSKVDFLVPLGTTGESATLNKEEKKRIVEFVAEVNAGRLPLVVGIGGNNTQEQVRALREFDASAYSAVLTVCPYYNKPTQEGIFQHYKALATESPLPIIVYNIPGRTGVNIKTDTLLRLAELPNIGGVKEASGDFEQFTDILRQMPPNFCFFSGDDALTLPIIALGGHGVISVVGNAYPKEMAEMVRLSLSGNFEEARKINLRLSKLIPLLFEEGNPPGIKTFLKELGYCDNSVRLPLVPPGEALSQRIAAAVENF